MAVMRRLAWSQLRFRTGRAVALLAGMLVAVTAFTVLTGAARTAQLRGEVTMIGLAAAAIFTGQLSPPLFAAAGAAAQE